MIKETNRSLVLSYRAFRAQVISPYRKEKERHRRADHDAIPCSALDEMRKEIAFFRGWVRDHLESVIANGHGREQLARRALGIPAGIALVENHRPWWRSSLQFFTPHRLVFQYVRSQLNQIRTFEGRDYLYTRLYARLFFHHNLQFYSAGLDIVLRRFPSPSRNDFIDVPQQEGEWIVAAWRLGLRELKGIKPYSVRGRRRTPGWFALAMVNERIIRSQEELPWLHYAQDDPWYSPHDLELQQGASRLIARLLLRFDVERSRIAGIYRFSFRDSDPSRLADNLEVLCSSGVKDLTGVFDAVGPHLWRTTTKTWRLVLNVIGARTPEAMLKLSKILEREATPPACIVEHLQTHGADIEALAHCQDMLLALHGEKALEGAMAAIDLLLTSCPGFSFQQLGKCSDYVRNPEALRGFLAVLTHHGYRSAADILDFQQSYRGGSSDHLDTWLTIVGIRRNGMRPAQVAEWVCNMRSQGHSDAYHYLLSAVPMPDFKALQQAEPLAVFGRGVLRYLVESKRIKTLSALRGWYAHARNVHDLRWWGIWDDPVFHLLMDDAYERKNYAFVSHNRACIQEVVHARIGSTCPFPPYPSPQEDVDRYHEEFEVKSEVELLRLMPAIAVVLEKTGGVLLTSLLRGDWKVPEELLARATVLDPMIDQLLMGNGPTTGRLDDLEMEVISLVYRTTVDTVRHSWKLALGQTSDLAGLALAPCYPMVWQRAKHRMGSKLERSSLEALTRADQYASLFTNRQDGDCGLFRDIQSKRLRHPARDPRSLTAHLGFLLATAGHDSEIMHWRTRGFDEVTDMSAEGGQVSEYMEQLGKLFDSSLPDAMDQHAGRFLSSFSADDAEQLAQRLAGAPALEDLTEPTDRLQKAYELVRENVLTVFQRWIKREKSKLLKVEDETSQTPLHAVLTKHPAAYFAKHATALCTRDRNSMWREDRHSHLAVFDPQQQRLVGMALVNIEVVAAIHPKRKCLILRALNPMPDMLAAHTDASIVDSYLDVAIQIADQNNLAAVLLPWHNGTHLLSNLSDIEKYLEKHYLKKAQPLDVREMSAATSGEDVGNAQWRTSPREVKARFSAYEEGQEIVHALYAIWRSDEKQNSGLSQDTVRPAPVSTV